MKFERKNIVTACASIACLSLLLAAQTVSAQFATTWEKLTDFSYVTTGTAFDARGTTLSQPRGGFYIGSHFWVSSAEGFNRLDEGASGQMYQRSTNAGLPSGVSLGGQPAFDALNNVVYVPDRNSKGRGINKITISRDTDQIISSYGIAPNAGLAGRKLSAVALGPDGHLYAGFESSGDIVRIENPSAPQGTPLRVTTVGRSVNGRRVFALAFMKNDLYIGQKDGLSLIPDITSCPNACVSYVAPQSSARDHYALVSVGNGGGAAEMMAVATNIGWGVYGCTCELGFLNSSVTFEDTRYAAYFANGVITPYNFARDFGFIWAPTLVVPEGQYTTQLFVLDDASGGLTPNTGRITHSIATPINGHLE